MNVPWEDKYALHVKFNAKWGGKKNSIIVDGGAPIGVVFPKTDGKGLQVVVPVTLKAGENVVSFGKSSDDWGYMFIQSIVVTAE